MPATFIPDSPGHLPASGPAPTASQLLSDYNALDANGKASFRQSIAAFHYIVSEDTDLLEISAFPGSTGSIADDESHLWRLSGPFPSKEELWINLLSGEPISEPDGVSPIGEIGKGRLVAVWESLSTAQRAAFRLAIKPAYSPAADQTARLALANQVPGDYCRQASNGFVYRLKQLPASVDGNWFIIYTPES